MGMKEELIKMFRDIMVAWSNEDSKATEAGYYHGYIDAIDDAISVAEKEESKTTGLAIYIGNCQKCRRQYIENGGACSKCIFNPRFGNYFVEGKPPKGKDEEDE